MEKNILSQIIIEQEKIFEKDIHIITREVPDNLRTSPKIVVITGVRRSGKSTLLRQLSKHYAQVNYINFEDERLIEFTYHDFNTLLETFLGLHPKSTTFFFDEIQEVKGWEKFARRLFTEGYKLYITGSNATLLSSEIATSITGRNLKIEVYPFSFQEYLSYNHIPIKKIYTTKEKAMISQQFKTYIRIGGFPEILQSKDFEELSQIYQDIIIKDLLVRRKIRDSKEFRELALFLLSNVSKKISYNNLKDLLNFSTTSKVKNYVDYLCEAYIFFIINKYDPSIKKQIINKKKIYVVDTGIVNAVSFQFSENKGRLLENAVFLELKRRGKDIYYFEGKNECDFLIKTGRTITQAIQVADTLSDPKTRKRELEGLLEAMDFFGMKTSCIITADTEEDLVRDNKHISILPFWKWSLQRL